MASQSRKGLSLGESFVRVYIFTVGVFCLLFIVALYQPLIPEPAICVCNVDFENYNYKVFVCEYNDRVEIMRNGEDQKIFKKEMTVNEWKTSMSVLEKQIDIDIVHYHVFIWKNSKFHICLWEQGFVEIYENKNGKYKKMTTKE